LQRLARDKTYVLTTIGCVPSTHHAPTLLDCIF
jgi:hypothetical protein